MRRLSFLLMILTLTFQLSLAQTPGGTWGPWMRSVADGTSIESRAKCEYSVGDGSVWSYEFKNMNPESVDVVEREEIAEFNSHRNIFGASGSFTLGPGKVSFPYETTLHGTCSQIPLLHIKIICVVPHGQDDPCFRNSDGSQVERKTSESRPEVDPRSKPQGRTTARFAAGPSTDNAPGDYVDRRLTATSIIGKWVCSPYLPNQARTAFGLRDDIQVELELRPDGSVSFGDSPSTYTIEELSVAFRGQKVAAQWEQNVTSDIPHDIHFAAWQNKYRVQAFFASDQTDNTQLHLLLYDVGATSQSPNTDFVCKWR